MRVTIVTLIALLTTFSIVHLIYADNPKQNVKVLRPAIIGKEPVLDGVLDDDAWKSGPILDDIFITTSPRYGEIFPQRTVIWMAYDHNNLYFAFYCYDTEPDKIKTSTTSRDNMFGDDYVRLTIDPNNNKHTAYDLFVNPNGIQGDQYLIADVYDSRVDFVWYSAGRVVEDGYIIEIKIPLESMRYTSGKDVEVGILFGRKIVRSSTSGYWPERTPETTPFDSMAKVVYGELAGQSSIELLPVITYSNSVERINPDEWTDPDEATEFGIDFKYNITSSLSTELTINPDFSQVESDAFQVKVNRKYPIFYSEKRPFFMETGHLFRLAGTLGDSNLRSAVHTRRIVDPDWGVKLTGELGDFTIGVLAAGDKFPGMKWEDDVNPDEGKDAYFTIGRAKYKFKDQNYIGMLYASREFAGDRNDVIGGDIYLRFLENHTLEGYYLFSIYDSGEGEGREWSSAFRGAYSYSSETLSGDLSIEHFDNDFRLDTGYFRRQGFTRTSLELDYTFYPESIPLINRITPRAGIFYLYDTIADMDEMQIYLTLSFNMTGNGYLELIYWYYKEIWTDQQFDTEGFDLSSGGQITSQLNVWANLSLGNNIYYDIENPFLGDMTYLSAGFTYQPDDKLAMNFSYSLTDFDRESDNEDIYKVSILNFGITYQFHKYFFTRAILRYDSYSDLLLTDLLASFTLVPGTVLHVGYGSLHQKLDWQDGKWIHQPGTGEYYQIRGSFFFKASYLWRL